MEDEDFEGHEMTLYTTVGTSTATFMRRRDPVKRTQSRTGATAIETFPAFYANSDAGANIQTADDEAGQARSGHLCHQITHCCCAPDGCVVDCTVLV